MNTPFFHNILEERRKNIKRDKFDNIRNGFVVEDPTNAIDCTPDTGFDNFQHIFNGDDLVYCELANSTPFIEHTVSKEFKPLVWKNARTNCVFSPTDITRMKKNVVGVKIVKHHGGLWMKQRNYIGSVAECSVLNDIMNEQKYKTLCLLCWISRYAMSEDAIDKNGLLYLSFGMKIKQETCCKCGKTSTVSTPCNHIKDNSPDSALSICVFNEFTGIELGNAKD